MTAAPERSFAWNATALSAAQLGAPVLNAALIITLARQAGPEILGTYSLLVTAFMVVDQLRLFGLQRFVTREVASGRADALDQLRGFLAVADLGGAAGIAIFLAYGLAVGAPPLAVLWFAAGLLPSARIWGHDAVFLARGRADFTTRVVAAESSLRVAASLGVLWWRGPDLAALAAVYATARALAALLGRHYRRRLVGPGRAYRDWRLARTMVLHAPAFFAVTALPLLLLRADLLVVGAFAAGRDVGLYGAATRLVSIALMLPDGMMLAIFAHLSRAADAATRRRVVAVVFAAGILVLVPAAAAVTWYSAPAASLVYGSAFTDAGGYLRWLIWSVPLFILCRALGDALIANGQERRLALVILTTVGASVPAYAVLTLRYGAVGAAMAYLVSLAVLLLLSAAAWRPSWPRLSPLRTALADDVSLEAR
jgi:O-antigen/teichoic acid export membrane protein